MSIEIYDFRKDLKRLVSRAAKGTEFICSPAVLLKIRQCSFCERLYEICVGCQKLGGVSNIKWVCVNLGRERFLDEAVE